MNASNNSIPQHGNQDKKLDSDQPLASALFGAPVAPVISPVLANALWWHERGANVIPLPYGGPKHPPYSWKQFKYTRLTREAVIELFPPRCNIAVITGRTSGNLVSLDADSPRAFKLVWQHLLDHELPMLVTRSTRGELAGHFLFRLADGTLENANYAIVGDRFARVTDTKTEVAELNVLGHDHLAVLPPSLNGARGAFYTWATGQTEHSTPAVEIPTYTLADLVDLLPGLALHGQRKPASGKSYGLVALEGWEAEVAGAVPGNRNNTLNAAAYRLGQLVAGGELSRQVVEYRLSQAAHAAGLHGAEVRDTIRSGLDAGEEEPRRRRSEKGFGHTPERAALEAWIAAYPWPTLGRRATTTRAVAEALAVRARAAHNGQWRASHRELAELARVSRRTIPAALDLLTSAGAITRTDTDHRSGASLWTLGPGAKDTTAPDGGGPGGSSGGGSGDDDGARNREFAPLSTLGSISGANSRFFIDHAIPDSSDAAERGALGKTGWRVWRWLLVQPEPCTITEIATALTLTHSQARHALLTVQNKSPADYPLVERVGRAWVANPMGGAALRDYVAMPHGTAGRGDARRAQHEAERAQRAYLCVLGVVRTWPGYAQHVAAMRAAGLLPGIDQDHAPGGVEYQRAYLDALRRLVERQHHASGRRLPEQAGRRAQAPPGGARGAA